MSNLLLSVLFITVFGSACSTYPKETISQSVQDLFRKELDVDVRTELVGSTLYVAFPLDNLVTTKIELPEESLRKLETAMLSVSRIALSTDAEITFTVIEARDEEWGVQTTLVRLVQDLKDLFYMRISKPDFDERFILEIGTIQSESVGADWHDVSLSEYLGRWVASRLSLGTKANLFLNILLGVESINSRFDEEKNTLYLTVSRQSSAKKKGVDSMKLLKSSIREQISVARKKYSVPDWVDSVVVLGSNGDKIFEMSERDLELKKEAAIQRKMFMMSGMGSFSWARKFCRT